MIGSRVAPRAGIRELTMPMARAMDRLIRNTAGGKDSPESMSCDCRRTEDAAQARPQPTSPPARDIRTASATIMLSTLPVVKPSVLSTPISVIRSRTDMPMVLAATSRMVNTRPRKYSAGTI